MKLVSDNGDDDLARQQASERMGYAARELASNLMRVVRGAGKPFDLGQQCADFLAAAQAFHDAHKVWPTDELHAWLTVNRPYEDRPGLSEGHIAGLHAVDTMIAGALQVAASRLVEQRPQEAAGHRELLDGVRWREGAVAQMQAEPRPSFEQITEHLKRARQMPSPESKSMTTKPKR